MIAVFVGLGVLVGVVLAVLLPRALLRKLEEEDQVNADREEEDR